jgi:hypothetical protein
MFGVATPYAASERAGKLLVTSFDVANSSRVVNEPILVIDSF